MVVYIGVPYLWKPPYDVSAGRSPECTWYILLNSQCLTDWNLGGPCWQGVNSLTDAFADFLDYCSILEKSGSSSAGNLHLLVQKISQRSFHKSSGVSPSLSRNECRSFVSLTRNLHRECLKMWVGAQEIFQLFHLKDWQLHRRL